MIWNLLILRIRTGELPCWGICKKWSINTYSGVSSKVKTCPWQKNLFRAWKKKDLNDDKSIKICAWLMRSKLGHIWKTNMNMYKRIWTESHQIKEKDFTQNKMKEGTKVKIFKKIMQKKGNNFLIQRCRCLLNFKGYESYSWNSFHISEWQCHFFVSIHFYRQN